MVDLETGNMVLSTNLDVSFAKFDFDIEDLKMKYKRRWNKEVKAVEIVPLKKLLKNSIRCKTCERVLVSKFTHDFQACACGNFVDGGLSYQRWGGRIEDIENLSVYED